MHGWATNKNVFPSTVFWLIVLYGRYIHEHVCLCMYSLDTENMHEYITMSNYDRAFCSHCDSCREENSEWNKPLKSSRQTVNFLRTPPWDDANINTNKWARDQGFSACQSPHSTTSNKCSNPVRSTKYMPLLRIHWEILIPSIHRVWIA